MYVGVTNDLSRRVIEHRTGVGEGFTARYEVHQLVYYEQCDDVTAAISREKQIKKWRRRWKLRLIESMNPDWRDLSTEWK